MKPRVKNPSPAAAANAFRNLPKCHPIASCPFCDMSIMVWKRGRVPAKVARLMAITDHIQTRHGQELKDLQRA